MTTRILLALIGLLTFLAIAQNAQAVAVTSEFSCSAILISVAVPASERTFRASFENSGESTATATCNDLSGAETQVARAFDAGSSFNMECFETTAGIAPPGPPDGNGIKIRAYADATGYPDGATFVWEQAFTSCLTLQTFTKYCTDNGLVGGSPRWGAHRLYVRAVRTDLGSYDDSSDSPAAGNLGYLGSYICKPKVVALTEGTAPATYEGGSTLKAWVNTTGQPNSAASSPGRIRAKCAPSIGDNDALSATPATSYLKDFTITTSGNKFLEGCDLLLNVSLTRNMAISGWTTIPYANWSSTDLPAGIVIQNTSRDIERDLTTPVTFRWTFDRVNNSATDFGANESFFTIGADQHFAKAFGLKNTTSFLQSGKTVTCTRRLPSGTTEAPDTMGTTDASGDSPSREFLVQSPSGTWSLTCNFSDAFGNAASYFVEFFYVSPLTSGSNVGISFNYTRDISIMNVTVILRDYNETCDCPGVIFPFNAPRLTILAYNTTNRSYDIKLVDRIPMVALDSLPDYWHNFTVTPTDLAAYPIYAIATVNISARPFIVMEGFAYSSSLQGNFSGNFTGNVTFLDAMGSLSLTTAFDDWIPILIWGGLFVAMLYFVAWFPAILALMNLAAQLPATPIYGNNAGIMFFTIGLAIHVMTTRSIVPSIWGRKERFNKE